VFVVRQLTRFTTAQGHQVNLRCAFIRRLVYVRNREGHQVSFGRNLRITNPAYFQEFVNRQTLFLSEGERHHCKQTYNRESKYAFHNYLGKFRSVVRESVRIIALLHRDSDWYAVLPSAAPTKYASGVRAAVLELSTGSTRITNVTELNHAPTLRPVTAGDAAFLLQVYKSSRGEDLRALGWDEARIDEFLQMQYEAQRAFDGSDYAQATDEVILFSGERAGRLLIDSREGEIRCVDLALLPEFRNRGLGTMLVRRLQQEAAAANKPLRLQVIRYSRAVNLFERLGFVRTSESGSHYQMEWKP
jgi:ribosomal protein S18 acetylase RimI-like enzyme